MTKSAMRSLIEKMKVTISDDCMKKLKNTGWTKFSIGEDTIFYSQKYKIALKSDEAYLFQLHKERET